MNIDQLPDLPMNGKALAGFCGIKSKMLYHHWSRLRQLEQLSQEQDPIPARGILQPHHAKRLAQFILYRRRAPKKVR